MYDYFVTISCNWSYDTDLFGYSFMNKNEVKDLKKKLKKKEDWLSIPIAGGNQDLEFDSGEECLECMEFIKISDENEYKVLTKFLGGENYCPVTPEMILEHVCEYDEETDDEDVPNDEEDEDEY